MGSSIIFVTAPEIWAIVENSEWPVDWSSFSYTAKKLIPKENIQHIRRYSVPICAISGFEVCEEIYALDPKIPKIRNKRYITSARNEAFPAALFAPSLFPIPSFCATRTLAPTPVPIPTATISICNGNARVKAFRALSPPTGILDTNALSTIL